MTAEPTEADFDRLLAKMKAKDPDFDLHVKRGRLMATKKAQELTAEERAFLEESRETLNRNRSTD